ncbi:LysR family transcriptional regulator [Achromobacter anxifer]|jgi:DNA-binding transcriptional LysR family regulator|uniref:LysR family transcriptional regulator n=1 Tax=Achromobacter anxifer TaxID=1287737 RepID=UPI002157C256|nr:LysR family transcriptional regulator [Achromobacter anxifer]MDF8360688.1 LysR family transcriptional regulator [Achromobacter anxifer]
MSASLRHIEIFHAVMTTGSVTRSAALLRTSQPTISRELKALERALGLRLFNRQGRMLSPTQEAVELHTQVERSYAGLDQIMRAASAIKDHTLGHIQVICLSTYAQTFLPVVCREFLAVHPGVRLTIHSNGQTEVMDALSRQRYDLGLAEPGPPLDNISARTLPAGQEVCILPRAHPLTRKKVLHPKDFDGVDCIHFPDDDAYRRNIDQMFAESGVTRSLRIETSSSAAVCAMVKQGLGVAIINPFSALECAGREIVVRPLAISVDYYLTFYRPAFRPQSPLVDEFESMVENAIKARVRQI